MVDEKVMAKIKQYLAALPARGIHARRAVLYGSQARGTAGPYSDIDLIVLAPEFDLEKSHRMVDELWLARADADAPIEPIPCGEVEWETDDWQPILQIARSEGIEISI